MKTLTVQSLLFVRGKWTPATAAAWLKKHNYKTPPVDQTADFLRYRQASPAHFRKGSFVTKDFSKDGTIRSVMAQLKTNKASVKPPKRRTRPASSSAPTPNKKRTAAKRSAKAPTISPVLVLLGTTRSLKLSTGEISKFGFPHWDMFTDYTGKRLYIFEHSKHYAAKSAAHKADAEKLYERWSDFEPDTEYTIRPRALDWIHNAKTKVVSITYRSNKWTGKLTDYIHKFETPPAMISGLDKNRTKRAIVLVGQHIKITKRGIEG